MAGSQSSKIAKDYYHYYVHTTRVSSTGERALESLWRMDFQSLKGVDMRLTVLKVEVDQTVWTSGGMSANIILDPSLN